MGCDREAGPSIQQPRLPQWQCEQAAGSPTACAGIANVPCATVSTKLNKKTKTRLTELAYDFFSFFFSAFSILLMNLPGSLSKSFLHDLQHNLISRSPWVKTYGFMSGSAPSFSSDTGQVSSVYGLTFLSFFSGLSSAANPASGPARKVVTRTATVIGFSNFIVFVIPDGTHYTP